jgi:hypothetical protein
MKKITVLSMGMCAVLALASCGTSKEIDADDAKIQTLWNSLFTKPEILSRNASPSKRLQSLLQVGAGAFDGALLAWKLYRRFKPRKR